MSDEKFPTQAEVRESEAEQILRLQAMLREAHLGLQDSRAVIAHLQLQLNGEISARQQDAGKRRDREAQLINEIRMLKGGVPTACVCPAGKCMNTAGSGFCWMKWAGQTAIRDVAQRALDEALRSMMHPRRMHEAQILPGPARLGADPVSVVTMPHICSFEKVEATNVPTCKCGRTI